MKIITAWDTKDGIALVHKVKNKRITSKSKDDGSWYFYILTKDTDRCIDILKNYVKKGIVLKREVGEVYTKVYAIRDRDFINLLQQELIKAKVPTFEFDLSKAKRYIINNHIGIETNVRILYFDIETDDSKGGISIGRDRIFSWAGCDKDGNEYFESGDEEMVLKSFIKVLNQYDVISGWNSEEFDLPYIQKRCELYDIWYDWRSIIHIDLLQRCFKIYGYEATHVGLVNFKLNTVAKFFLGVEKTELQGMKIHELYKDHKELLKEYNLNDAKLVRDLDVKLGIIDLMIKECEWTGALPNKFYIGELLDSYILREAHKQGVIMKSRPSIMEADLLKDVKIAGGYVKKPVPGLYKNVHICDFKSLYPSIIVGWNIGEDSLNEILTVKGQEALAGFLGTQTIEEKTFVEWREFLSKEKQRLDPKNEYIQTANNAFFKRDKASFIGGLVQTLLNERAEYKKKLKTLDMDTAEYANTYAAERVVKEMANSMFGITCDKSSRYFNRYTSEGITFTGQYLNKASAYFAEELGLSAIYGDTDSIFVTGIEDFSLSIKQINEKLSTFLDDEIGLIKNIVFLEYEKTYKSLILLEKKRYSGLLTMKDGKAVDKIFSRGTEDIKKSTTRLGKKIYVDLAMKILRFELNEETAIKYVEDLRHDIFTREIDPNDIAITSRISKELHTYKVDTMQVRLATRLINEKKITPIVVSEKKMGTRLTYVVIQNPTNPKKNEGMLLEEFDGTWHKEHYWKKEFFAPIRRILECVYPNVDWMKYNKAPKL